MRKNRFATMINALTEDELASSSPDDLLLLLEGLQRMGRTPEVETGRCRIAERLMGSDRLRPRTAVVVH